MCFSASASFTSAVVLSAIGLANLRNIKNKKEWMLAIIPLLFGIQQFTEGVIWVEANAGRLETSFLAYIAGYSYLFFAFLVWPVWVPASILMIETVKWRKIGILICLILGSYVSLMHLTYVPGFSPNVQVGEYRIYLGKMFGFDSNIELTRHSIQYIADIVSYKLFYGLAVSVPCLFSSFPALWVFGFLTGGALLVADYFYSYAFVSVWCFFSALISAILYKVIKDQNKRTFYEKR